MRTSPVHYIAPSAISIVPNCNGSPNDIAVTIAAKGTKIKVYCPRAGIDKVKETGEYQEWILAGRNRRLADSTKPYTIYARLPKSDKTKGYVVFSPMTSYPGDVWIDKHLYLDPDSIDGLADLTGAFTEDDNWWVKLGDVSLPDTNNQRTVNLDTGILGTDQFNDEWALRPDELPLRIELGCTINDEDAGPTPYVYWGQSIVLTAMLAEGWTGTDIQRFDRWEIVRNSGDATADNAWNYQQVEGEETLQRRQMPGGQITLNHARGADDDFNGAVSVTFTILAVGHNADTLQDEILKTAIINIMAETVEKYELSLSDYIVKYDPQTQNYAPSTGVNVGIRATDQRGEVFNMTRGQIANAFLVAEYAPVNSFLWTALKFQGTLREAGIANIGVEVFALKQSVNVRLMRRITADGQTVTEKELSRTTIAFVQDGEDSKVREWIYRLNSNAGYNATTGTAGGTAVSGQTDGVDNCLLVDDFVPTGWSDDPTGVSQPGDVEWESWRDYDDAHHRWGAFHEPVIHNRYAEDAVTYRLECNIESIRIPANETSVTQNLRAILYQRTGTAAEEEHPCYWAIYNKQGSSFRRMYASNRLAILSLENYMVSSDSDSEDYADAVVFVCAEQAMDGDSYRTSLPDALIVKTEIPVIKDGNNAPYNEHFYAISRSRTSHALRNLYSVNGACWFPTAPDPRATHPYVWECIMHYTAAGVNDQTSYICLTGAVGAMGKMCYMAGEYRADVEYTSNDSQTVAVEVSGTDDTTDIYYLNAETNWPDGTAQSAIGPTDSGQTIWVQGMSQYNLVRARYLFADFAQFGSAVVSGDWLISVHGTINGTAYDGDYNDPKTYTNGSETKPTYFWFDPAYPNEDHAGEFKTPGSPSSGRWGTNHHNFIPNYAVNLLTGKTYQNDAFIRGEVHATSGEFRGKVYASDGEFTGKVIANSGSFSGSSNGFEIKLDADNRLFSLSNPTAAIDEDLQTVHPEAIEFKSLSFGNFFSASSLNGAYFITPQIKIVCPQSLDNTNRIEVTLDAFNGIEFNLIRNGKKTPRSHYGLGGMTTGSIFIENPDIEIPPARDYAAVGQVYRDGEVLKIKLSE